jgi:hypothetical protein
MSQEVQRREIGARVHESLVAQQGRFQRRASWCRSWCRFFRIRFRRISGIISVRMVRLCGGVAVTSNLVSDAIGEESAAMSSAQHHCRHPTHQCPERCRAKPQTQMFLPQSHRRRIINQARCNRGFVCQPRRRKSQAHGIISESLTWRRGACSKKLRDPNLELGRNRRRIDTPRLMGANGRML